MNIVTNAETPWLCLKDPESKLVYWVHSKCACSFYKKIFAKLNWTETTTTDIDWENDVVFSHIRDPLVKHRIGIIEWFYQNNSEKLLKDNFDNNQFFLLLSQATYLDIHSMSIFDHLGKEKSSKIKWIPLDTNVNHVKETVELIEQYATIADNTKEQLLNLAPYHVSTGFKKWCNEKILRIPPTPLIIKSIEYDRWLYDTVTKKNFEPANYSQQIKYLKSQGLTQQQAEQQADNDVQTGNYLNWNKE